MTNAREIARLVYRSMQTSIDPIGVIYEAIFDAQSEAWSAALEEAAVIADDIGDGEEGEIWIAVNIAKTIRALKSPQGT